mmetsp:Transcript_16617/g.49624  ORF Transcript_16617/g.49624 Transcript_16617/m.49624 type:complete len:312 (+) Transcript_16617:159-1094(+)
MDAVTGFVARLALCEGSIATQLTLALLQAVFWHHFLHMFSTKVVRPWCESKPWLKAFTARAHETWTKGYGIPFKDEAMSFEFACYIVSTVCLHFVGGGLCIPAVCFGVRNSVTTALALHGAMCEVGFDLSEGYTRVRQVYGFEGQAGRDKNPPVVLFLATMHHVMGLAMVLPMNCSEYRSDANYHELVFLLQSVAFVALIAQYYSYTLDVEDPGDLLRMRLSVTFTFACMLYSRGLRFAIVGSRLLDTLNLSGNVGLYIGGCLALGTMFVFNLVVTVDCAGKFSKFVLGPGKVEAGGSDEDAAAVEGKKDK